jgi:outer membrane immunogenic protein
VKKLGLSVLVAATFGCGSAMAADMPLKAPPQVAATVFSWTGFYIGVEGGYGHTDTSSVRNVANSQFPVGFTESATQTGALVGVEGGFNYQWQWLVLGVEGDWQGSAMKGSTTTASVLNGPIGGIPGAFVTSTRETDWISTVTGRLGLAWDRWLVYGKGGAAWRRINESANNITFSAAGAVLAVSQVLPSTETGYVVGGGVEWAPADAVSLKVEYDWYNFGSQSGSGTLRTCCGAPVGTFTGPETTNSPTAWEIKGAINFHWNPFPIAPVAARY